MKKKMKVVRIFIAIPYRRYSLLLMNLKLVFGQTVYICRLKQHTPKSELASAL